VLAPGGRLVVGFMPRERKDRVAVPGDVFTPRSPDEVIEALAGAGFGDLAVARPDPARAWNLIVARQGVEAGEVATAATMRLAPRDSGRLAVSLLEEVALQQS
jgi:hypothetical protein